MTMGGEQVEHGHAVVLTLATLCEGDTLVVPKLDRLARFVPDPRHRPRQGELCRMHAKDEYSISDLTEFFSVSRPTASRTLNWRHFP